MKICPKCHSEHVKNGNFCSRSCANSKNWSEEDKKKKSEAFYNSKKVQEHLKRLRSQEGYFPNKKDRYKVSVNCVSCQTPFLTNKYCPAKFCSGKCNPKVGGYREGSGHSKSGYYKGIYSGSTYELCWIIYSLDHKINFTRFPQKLCLDGITYFPDFLLEDGKTIVEIKGYEQKSATDKKSSIAKSLGYNIKVLYKNDLIHCFNYVKLKYGTDKFEKLYDDFKPSFQYICPICKTNFFRIKKSKIDFPLCSRSCSGKLASRCS